MYYLIEHDIFKETDEETFYHKEDTICILDMEEWTKADKLREHFGIRMENPLSYFCKIENHAEYLHATFRIPVKSGKEETPAFSFYLTTEKIIFVDSGDTVEKQIKKLQEEKMRSGYTLERFLYDFLVGIFEEDLFFLQKMEQYISTIEEEVLKGNCENFNQKMLGLKKKIAVFYRYYSQLTEIGQELLENEMDFFEKEDLRMFDRYAVRATRFMEETQLLREYAMQVQDVYQSEIGIRQNDVMKMLTIVTTIFLPLTLIVGWYGMNFVNMPELSSQYGYPIIIIISLFIIIISLFVFRKKKYW